MDDREEEEEYKKKNKCNFYHRDNKVEEEQVKNGEDEEEQYQRNDQGRHNAVKYSFEAGDEVSRRMRKKETERSGDYDQSFLDQERKKSKREKGANQEDTYSTSHWDNYF